MAERKSLFEKIGTLEPAPSWTLGTVALTILVAFVAVIIGTTVALVWFEGQPFATLLGWTLGSVITVLFADGEMSSVSVVDKASGLYLEPLPADTLGGTAAARTPSGRPTTTRRP